MKDGPDARNRLIQEQAKGYSSPKRPSAGNLSARISSPWKKKMQPFHLSSLIMNKLLSSPLGTKEQNSKEECRRPFFEWRNRFRKERNSKQTGSRLALSVVHYEVCHLGLFNHPLGPKIHHLWQGETAGAWLSELAPEGQGESLEVDVVTGSSCLPLAPHSSLAHPLSALRAAYQLVPGLKLDIINSTTLLLFLLHSSEIASWNQDTMKDFWQKEDRSGLSTHHMAFMSGSWSRLSGAKWGPRTSCHIYRETHGGPQGWPLVPGRAQS